MGGHVQECVLWLSTHTSGGLQQPFEWHSHSVYSVSLEVCAFLCNTCSLHGLLWNGHQLWHCLREKGMYVQYMHKVLYTSA